MNKEELFVKKLYNEARLNTPSEERDMYKECDRISKKELNSVKKELKNNNISESEYLEWKNNFIDNAYNIAKKDNWITHHYFFIGYGKYSQTFPDYELDNFLRFIKGNGSAFATEKTEATEEEIKNAIALNADTFYKLMNGKSDDCEKSDEEIRIDVFKQALQYETMLNTPSPLLDNDQKEKECCEEKLKKAKKYIEDNNLIEQYNDWSIDFINNLYKDNKDKDWVTKEFEDMRNVDINNIDTSKIKVYRITVESRGIDIIDFEMYELIGPFRSKEPVKATEDEVKLLFKLHAIDM